MPDLQEGGTLAQITTIKSIENVKISKWPCPKVNNIGVSTAWDWRVAAATAVALLSTAASFAIADMQYQTAKAYWRLARERWDYFLTTYRPCETSEVAEACTTKVPTPQYNYAIAAYTNGANLAFNRADVEILRLSKLYCICQDNSLARDIDLMRSQMIGDGVNYAIRREEAVAEALDDVRWNRKIGVLNRGRGMLAQSTSYARAAQEMYDQFGKSVSAVASGATEFIGYALNRNKTTYPTNTPLVSGGYAGYSTPPQSSDQALTQYIQNASVPVTEIGSPTGGEMVGVSNTVNAQGRNN